MSVLPELKPPCVVAGTMSWWEFISTVNRCLKRHGLPNEASEFRTRATALNQADALENGEWDLTELLAVAVDYVEIR